ncbi:hypothetical protein [Cellulomonas sp. SLBN-39]|uniref:hypothetical protein n=1 Tax=Cellulomonas sp. SLBN-39 TaxID=2768446 RepID=UPI0011544844|nr:hypothetical protein [Cellulomonas sp. SLBN-39]TQL04296.1 hypothetical protein FBY24_3413 [Cellulomonas sp. SLBN-39]
MATTVDLGLVETYVEDHVTGATGIIERLGRMQGAPGLVGVADDLARLRAELVEERALHLATARDLGLAPSRSKRVLAAVAERAARLKPNRRLRTPSPLTPLLELEIVRSGIEGKRLGWLTLRAHADDLGLDGPRIDGLVERSRDQAVRVEAMAAHVRGGAFDPTSVQPRRDRS